MNICSLSKVTLVATAVVVAAGVAEPTKAFGLQTGTFPVIVKDGKSFAGKTKDTGSFPIIINPNPSQVQGDGGNGPAYHGGKGFDDGSYTLTVTLNQATTLPQVVVMVSSDPSLISVPLVTVVPAGQMTSSTTFSVPYSSGKHHHNVHVWAAANGKIAECTIKVHYKGEQD